MELRYRNFGDFFGEDFAKDLILIPEDDRRDLLYDSEIFFRGEGEQRDEGIKFSVAYDIIPDFRDSVGLVFDSDFDECLWFWLDLVCGDLLSDSVAFEFGYGI